jgi:long-subunit acyl-CoA synthetase (AMP-forming)
VDDAGELHFRGPNACLGTWDATRDDAPLDGLAADAWRPTGDLARREDDGTLTWLGRTRDTFKLGNGRFVAAAAVERRVLAGVPGACEALLSSSDGHRLVLALTMAGDAPLPSEAAVRALVHAEIGAAARTLHLVAVPAAAWVRTPKGELDRRWPTGRGRGAARSG